MELKENIKDLNEEQAGLTDLEKDPVPAGTDGWVLQAQRGHFPPRADFILSPSCAFLPETPNGISILSHSGFSHSL